MKSTTLVAGVALLAAVFSVAANAQGRPAEVETKTAPYAQSAPVDVEQVGSYARYLMLNGETREEALLHAQSYDHPESSHRVALRTPSTPAKTTQQ